VAYDKRTLCNCERRIAATEKEKLVLAAKSAKAEGEED
jgi:hypothetical protein